MATQLAPAAIDILDRLRDDHHQFDKFFASYEEAEGAAAKRDAVCRLYCALLSHAQAAEELLFAAMIDAGSDDELIEEARAEHEAIRRTLQSILAVEADDPTYDMKVRMLRKEVVHHAREEESELFTLARDARLDLADLGERFSLRLRELHPQLEREVGLEPVAA